MPRNLLLAYIATWLIHGSYLIHLFIKNRKLGADRKTDLSSCAQRRIPWVGTDSGISIFMRVLSGHPMTRSPDAPITSPTSATLPRRECPHHCRAARVGSRWDCAGRFRAPWRHK